MNIFIVLVCSKRYIGHVVVGGLVAKSCPTLATPWTVACQVPLSMEFPGRNTVVDCHFLLQGYNIVNKVDNMV